MLNRGCPKIVRMSENQFIKKTFLQTAKSKTSNSPDKTGLKNVNEAAFKAVSMEAKKLTKLKLPQK